MTIRVEIDGRGQVAEFPDGTDQAVIDAAVKRDFFGGTQSPTPQPAGAGMPWMDVASQAMKNIPQSAVGYGKALVQPFLHPADTMNSIGSLIEGGLGTSAPANKQGDIDKLNQFRGMLADRYGGYENIKRTIATDPVGSLADASTLLTGGGWMVSKLPGMVGKAGEIASAVGRAVEPVNLAKQTIVRGAQAVIPKGMPMRLYESALKPGAPTKAFTREQQLEALQAGLDRGITGTKRGHAKVEETISALQDDIAGMIATGDAQGRRVDKGIVKSALNRSKEYFKDIPGAEGYLKDIEAIEKSFDGQHGNYIAIEKAQEVKQKIGTMVRKSYGQLSTATTEALKDIAFGLKEEIADIFPEITNKNHLESMMIRLEPIVEKAAARISKRDVMGIGTPIAGGAVGAATGSWKVAAAATLTKAILDNPSVKTHIAILLNKAKKGGMGPGFVEQRLAAYWAGKAKENEQQSPY